MDLLELAEPQQQLVRDELASGERVVWLAQPTFSGKLPWVAWIPALFGIPFTLFALFWIASAAGLLFGGGQAGPGPPDLFRWIFPLFGVPFVLTGLGIMSSPYWTKRRMRRTARQTVYVVTDRRAIIFDAGYYGDSGLSLVFAGVSSMLSKGIRVRSYSPEQLTSIERVQNARGTGNVLFGEAIIESVAAPATNGAQYRPTVRAGFYSIDNVKGVDELVKALAATA